MGSAARRCTSGRQSTAGWTCRRPGQCGRNAVERADGTNEELPGTASVEMAPGDVFVIETPGGGGYGSPQRADSG